MIAHFTPESSNIKTGNIPVTTSPSWTCPDACPLKDQGCYARFGPLGIHWEAVSRGERGDYWPSFLQRIASIPMGAIWRHNQAGDLPGYGDEIDGAKLQELVDAQAGRRGFTYTHKPVTWGPYREANMAAVYRANQQGFTINLSANTLSEADWLSDLNIAPVVVILPRDAQRTTYTPGGRKVITCPAQTTDGITCKDCGLCQRVNRTVIVGFLAHGTAQRKVDMLCRAK